MARTLYCLSVGLLTSAMLFGQAPAKQGAQAAGLGTTAAVSNQEMNIRAYMELLRKDVRAQAAQIVGAVMQLDADESAKFWPVYKEFEGEYVAIGDKIGGLIRKYAENYGSLNGQVATELGNGVLSIEQQRHDLKKKYFDRMKTAVDPITAVRFLQVFNQLERLMDLQIASQLPVFGKE